MSAIDLLLEDLAARVVERLRPELQVMLSQSKTVASGAPVAMTRRAYAARVALSVRTLDSLLPDDAYAGEGRLKRVVVARADSALLVGEKPATKETAASLDPIEQLARRTARKGRRT